MTRGFSRSASTAFAFVITGLVSGAVVGCGSSSSGDATPSGGNDVAGSAGAGGGSAGNATGGVAGHAAGGTAGHATGGGGSGGVGGKSAGGAAGTGAGGSKTGSGGSSGATNGGSSGAAAGGAAGTTSAGGAGAGGANAGGSGGSATGGSGGTTSAPGYAIGYADCPAPAGTGTTYTIGLSGSGPQTIAAFTHWNELAPGDVVCIYGQATPYAERLVLTQSGSDDTHRIRIVGVVQNGDEPIVTGNGATTADAFNYGANMAGNYENGEVSITGLGFGMPVSYLNVEGLTIEGATTAEVSGSAASPTYSVNTYADPSLNGGAQSPWGCGSAGVNIIRADHVSLIHNRIRDNDNGIFVNSNNGNTSSNLLISENHIYGNGVFGEQQGAWNPGKCGLDAHGVYSEASGITYLANRFGAPRQGEATNLLKDRSSGLVVAYNLFEPDGALEATIGSAVLVGATPQSFGHILDLVESYDSSVGFNTLGAAYDNASVYGNIFFDDSAGASSDQGTTVPLHFGGDQGNPAVYRQHLHFYNNTVVARRDSTNGGTFGWFELETGTDAEAWNNIFYAAANQTTTPQMFTLLNTYCYQKPCGTTEYLDQNWVSPIWGTTGVNAAATDPSFKDLANNDVHIGSNNPVIVGNGQVGDASFPANATTLPLEYADFLSTVPRPFSAAKVDLGALGY